MECRALRSIALSQDLRYVDVQVALAEQLASHNVLEGQAAFHVAALQERESQMCKELRELRIASGKEINSLKHRLDAALQVQPYLTTATSACQVAHKS